MQNSVMITRLVEIPQVVFTTVSILLRVIVTGTLTVVKVWCVALTGDGRQTSAFPDQTPGTTPGQTGQSGLTALSGKALTLSR